jgi:hypothetical protein
MNEAVDSGFSISAVGQLLFVRRWGVLSRAQGHEFAQQYLAICKPLQAGPWAEVIDLRDAIGVEQGHAEEVAILFQQASLQANMATAYIVSERTAAEHLRDLQRLIASQTASFADEFFDNPIDALNWVNQRLAAASS